MLIHWRLFLWGPAFLHLTMQLESSSSYAPTPLASLITYEENSNARLFTMISFIFFILKWQLFILNVDANIEIHMANNMRSSSSACRTTWLKYILSKGAAASLSVCVCELWYQYYGFFADSRRSLNWIPFNKCNRQIKENLKLLYRVHYVPWLLYPHGFTRPPPSPSPLPSSTSPARPIIYISFHLYYRRTPAYISRYYICSSALSSPAPSPHILLGIVLAVRKADALLLWSNDGLRGRSWVRRSIRATATHHHVRIRRRIVGMRARRGRCAGMHLLQHLVVTGRERGVLAGWHSLVDRIQALGLGKGLDFVIRRETVQRVLQRRLAARECAQWQGTGRCQSL